MLLTDLTKYIIESPLCFLWECHPSCGGKKGSGIPPNPKYTYFSPYSLERRKENNKWEWGGGVHIWGHLVPDLGEKGMDIWANTIRKSPLLPQLLTFPKILCMPKSCPALSLGIDQSVSLLVSILIVNLIWIICPRLWHFQNINPFQII